jgi:hypothetical protein
MEKSILVGCQHQFLDAFRPVAVATIVSTHKAAGEFPFHGFAIK